jgi:hypothetical protein
MKRHQDWATLVLAAWMIASPWTLDFADAYNPAAWFAWGCGVAMPVFTGISLSRRKRSNEVFNVLLGIALLASPWMLDFSEQSVPTQNSVIVGLLRVAWTLLPMFTDAARRMRFVEHGHAR